MMSAEPNFVMPGGDSAAKPNMHYNLTWNALEDVTYPRLPPGKSLTIFSPNVRNPVEVLPTEYVIITRCTRSLPDDPAPLAHCAHYHYNKRCARGADCGFVHVVRLAGLKPHYINISPATVAGYRASEAKRTAEHTHGQRSESGKQQQPLMVPVPVPPFSPFVPGNEALMSGGIMFRPSSMVQSGGAPLSWGPPTPGDLPAQQMALTPATVAQLPIRVGISGTGLPPPGATFFSPQGMPSQQPPSPQYSVASYPTAGFAPSHMQWPPSVFEQPQQPQQLQNPTQATVTWSHPQQQQQSQQQQHSLVNPQLPPTAIMQPPQFQGMGGEVYQNPTVLTTNPSSHSNLQGMPSQQPPPMFVFLPSFHGQNPSPPSAQ